MNAQCALVRLSKDSKTKQKVRSKKTSRRPAMRVVERRGAAIAKSARFADFFRLFAATPRSLLNRHARRRVLGAHLSPPQQSGVKSTKRKVSGQSTTSYATHCAPCFGRETSLRRFAFKSASPRKKKVAPTRRW